MIKTLKVDVIKEINSNPLTYAMYEAREDIIYGSRTVKVPFQTLEFFKNYAVGVKRSSEISGYYFQTPKPKSEPINLAIMYSGGSESQLMRYTFEDAVLVEGYDFYDYTATPYCKREFQLALLGICLNVKINMIGVLSVEKEEYLSKPYLYEFSEDFVSNWDANFPCNSIQYPLIMFDKVQIYNSLISHGYYFNWCEVSEKPCGSCWKCFEAFSILKAINQDVNKFFEKIYYEVFAARYNEVVSNPFFDPIGTNNLIFSLEKKYNLNLKEVL